MRDVLSELNSCSPHTMLTFLLWHFRGIPQRIQEQCGWGREVVWPPWQLLLEGFQVGPDKGTLEEDR